MITAFSTDARYVTCPGPSAVAARTHILAIGRQLSERDHDQGTRGVVAGSNAEANLCGGRFRVCPSSIMDVVGKTTVRVAKITNSSSVVGSFASAHSLVVMQNNSSRFIDITMYIPCTRSETSIDQMGLKIQRLNTLEGDMHE